MLIRRCQWLHLSNKAFTTDRLLLRVLTMASKQHDPSQQFAFAAALTIVSADAAANFPGNETLEAVAVPQSNRKPPTIAQNRRKVTITAPEVAAPLLAADSIHAPSWQRCARVRLQGPGRKATLATCTVWPVSVETCPPVFAAQMMIVLSYEAE